MFLGIKISKVIKVLTLILLTFLTCTAPHAFTISIQETIKASAPGEKVVIRKGEYVEQVIINRTVHLIGEDPNAVIINSNGKGNVITIFGEHIFLESLSIKNSGNGFAGVHVKAKNVTIANCLIMDCYIGIRIDSTSKTRIINCTLLNNTLAGIWIWGACGDIEIHNCTVAGSKYAVGLLTFSQRNTLLNNVIYNNYVGVALINSRENQIIKNKILNNTYGLWFEDRLSTENVVSKNTLSNNICGIYINIFNEGSTNNLFYSNNFINNTVQVRLEPPYYSINHWNLSYPLGGNYWSDHASEDSDSDGFLDKPYVIAKNNVDYYPLARPYREAIVEKISDSDKEWFSQIIIAIIVIVAVYGLTYLLFRRRWPDSKLPEEY